MKSVSYLWNESRALLVHGDIRNIESDCDILNVPKEIKDIVYMYQKLCDKWDKTKSHKDAIINENLSHIRFKMKGLHGVIAFGAEIVSQGIFKWTLKIMSVKHKKLDASLYIGIMENDEWNFIHYKSSGSWQRVGYQSWAGNGGLWCRDRDEYDSEEYDCLWENDGDILELILSLNQAILQLH